MLRDNAMLIRLSISQWSGRRFDKKATAEVEATRTVGIGRFNKSLIDPALIKGVQQAATKLRNAHYARTMPWDDAEYRLLASKMYFEHSQLMQELESGYWREVEFVLANYEVEKRNSAHRLGDLFIAQEYPSVESLRDMYGVNWSVIPIPEAGDFRVDVGDKEVEQIKVQIEARVAQASKAAISDIWDRLSAVVAKVHERLSDPSAVFRDTLIGNIEELCELIPKLNFNDDPDLNRMQNEVLNKLSRHTPQTLRDNQHARREVAADARSILAKMDSFLGVKR